MARKDSRKANRRKVTIFVFVLLYLMGAPKYLFAEQVLTAQKVEVAPIIDGSVDVVWDKVDTVTTHDNVANIDITLKAVYTDTKIFFLVSFPDSDESRTHKSWVWESGEQIYTMGPDREDVFVIKWNMEDSPVDLSIFADNVYRADIWFWKACRTDPKGYADDKMHVLSFSEMKYYTELASKNGRTVYLTRAGDEGESVYATHLPVNYDGDTLLRFIIREPSGSRADVRAKGVWADGRWTIEFGRALNTGNNDDISFDASESYQFGVSRYEIAGRDSENDTEQPLYGGGDISENLILNFENK